ncbi:protein kinase [Sorangium cellulosum]|uniref:Protein kinase n=1 Tax=Sorangium cellulosum TaxID=56 RepID=A0A4P2PUA5_SORCE|nr:serine/threonine-protein kinase [Sorangium cellulosum]AUX20257.1 protein kinase [Sorangium cellulosum]
MLEGTPYRALRGLGVGGMGEVVEAEHRALGKRVVVKLVRRALAHDPRFADRLRVEARALAAVASPHVVAVLDLGETPAGRPYFVMERLEGRTLREELERRGPLPVAEAIEVTRQVLAGLSAAHRVGLVHRDVKLDNVFLCAPGAAAPGSARVAKVLDFGVAKVAPVAAGSFALAAPAYPTEAGLLVGTPRTASPEQARCRPVDARTDVYAVGLLMYTLLVGHGPFAHVEDALALLHAHVHEAPAPPSRYAAQGIPPALDGAVLKALAKRAEDRFQSAEAFAEELGRIAAALAEAGGSAGAAEAAPGWASARRRGEEPGGGEVAGGGEAGSGWGPESRAWFEAVPGGEGGAGAGAGAARAEAAVEVDARLFAGLTVASTMVFSLIAALVLRGLGVW